jgi:serine/threonine protein kinase
LTLGRDVALKTLPRLTGAAADRLKREAQSMARVAAPGLATIHGVESWRGAPVLVIELLEGGTLADRIRGGPLAFGEAISIASQIVRCLGDLHAQGLLHRDVKPANAGFTARGQVKLLDFGLAAAVETSEVQAGSAAPSEMLESGLAGTLLYMPPESFAGAPPSEAVDLWGAAMSLYECVAGRHPLADASSFKEALRRLREGRIPDVRRFRPDCPAELAVLLSHALAPSLAERGQILNLSELEK